MTTSHANTLVKCCGMFRPQDIAAVNAAQPDFCGFVIDFPKSHRSVTAQQAQGLRQLLDPRIRAVGVFVDTAPEQVARTAEACSFSAVQLHGSETAHDIEELRKLTDAKIIQAFKVRGEADLESACSSSADFVLLDNGQGTGSVFDWGLLRQIDRPYFLAGGLTPENIPEAIERFRPYAIDISSGLETRKLKDAVKIAAAVAAARNSALQP